MFTLSLLFFLVFASLAKAASRDGDTEKELRREISNLKVLIDFIDLCFLVTNIWQTL